MTAAANEFENFFDREEIKLLIEKDLNLLRVIFLMVELSRIFPHPQKWGTVHTLWVQQFCDIFGKKGDA